MQVDINSNTKLLQRYQKIRQISAKICQSLGKEDYVVQPVVDVSPPKWHLAHVTWFFETFILIPFKKDYQLFDDDYSYVFNSYYETVGKRVLRANRGNLTRPNVDDVYRYRQYVDQQMAELLSGDFEVSDEFSQVFEIGLQHEQQHQELLVTDIKYILGHNPLFPDYFKAPSVQPTTTAAARPAKFLEVEAGLYMIGHQGPGFCFDNELGRHQVFLHDFRIMDRLVTNAEYLQFIQDGGYEDFRHWLMEGWEWVKANKINAPMYWYQVEDKWHSYTLRGLEPIDWHAPVTHLSYYEADAFARWKGMRLPTEFEWEVACQSHEPAVPHQAQFQDGFTFLPAAAQHNYQFFGEAWEWTSSPYTAYPYFQTAPGALGEYNGKFMVNQMVLRGGSCATPRDHIRSTYRNFFHPYLRWQFTGLRMAYNP